MARVVVVDARCIVDVLFNGQRALDVLDEIYGNALAAPAHVDMDVLATLARLNPSDVPEADTRRRVEVYLRIPMKRFDIAPLMLEAWDRRRDLCVKDALYVALADHLKVPLVTRNRAMAASCSRAILVQATSGWGGTEQRQDFFSE